MVCFCFFVWWAFCFCIFIFSDFIVLVVSLGGILLIFNGLQTLYFNGHVSAHCCKKITTFLSPFCRDDHYLIYPAVH